MTIATPERLERTRAILRSRWSVIAIVAVVVLVGSSYLEIPWIGDLSTWLIQKAPPQAYIFVQYAVPIGFGALCGLMCERSGVVNIGIEGMMLTAAFVAFLAGAYLDGIVGSPWAAVGGVFFGIFAAMLLSALHAWLSITVKADQIIGGTVINILALGGTAFFNQLLVSTSGLHGTSTLPKIQVPNEIADIPLVGWLINAVFNQGPIAISLFVFVGLLHVLLWRSRWGLRTRAVGEHPKAADTVGIDVYRTRYINVILGGVFAGLAGAFLTLELSNSFEDNLTGGKGFIGLAAMIFGRWTPIGALGGALLFGTALTLQLISRIPSSAPGGPLGEWVATVPPQLFGAIPYVLTIIVLAGVVGRAIPPAADGVPYDKESRA